MAGLLGYFIIIAPGALLAFYATMKTRRTFARYSRIGSRRGYSGRDAAYEMMRRAGIRDVRIEQTSGLLSDHYDPLRRVLRLSQQNFSSSSLAAIGVACHEAGHAIQHAQGYAMLSLRTALVPAVSFCSTSYVFVIMFGALLRSPQFIVIGLVMFIMAVVFAVVTLPVEWDASRRAKMAMVEAGFLTPDEARHAAEVLDAAFLTYLASALTAVLTLLYYLLRFGLIGGRQDD